MVAEAYYRVPERYLLLDAVPVAQAALDGADVSSFLPLVDSNTQKGVMYIIPDFLPTKVHSSEILAYSDFYAVARCCSWLPSRMLITFETPGSCMVTP